MEPTIAGCCWIFCGIFFNDFICYDRGSRPAGSSLCYACPISIQRSIICIWFWVEVVDSLTKVNYWESPPSVPNDDIKIKLDGEEYWKHK